MPVPEERLSGFPKTTQIEQVGEGGIESACYIQLHSHNYSNRLIPCPRTGLSTGQERNAREVRARKSGEVPFPACSAAHRGAPDVSRRASGSAQGRWFPAPGGAREVKPVGVSFRGFETLLSRFPFVDATP